MKFFVVIGALSSNISIRMTPLLVSTRTTRFLAVAAGFCPSALGAGLSAGAGVLPLPEQPVISSIDADSISNIV